ncbi:MAG: arylsulfatase [Acidobacteria bacterium]|nr:arylsulfatase [Acidobacteriota bacterium]
MRISRRGFMRAIGAGAMLARPATAQRRGPNIVWIMADDLGYGDVGCYGQEKILTPNIDRLAEQGMRFTQAYAGSTVCAPSRCSLMTGLHNGHGRVRDNIPYGIFLRPDDFTVAELLKQAGYRTGGFGKWSLGNAGSWGMPLYQGFDTYFGQLNQDQAHRYYPDSLWDDDQEMLLMGNRANQRKQYSADLFAERALRFIGDNRERPFFLYFATTLPHFSDFREGPDKLIVPSDEPYTTRDWPQLEKNYAAMVTRLDRHVGEIMAKLREHGLEQNTLVFFTSDNGPWDGHDVRFFRSAGSLRGVKRDLYEGGIRVPMIVRWPDRIRAGSVSHHPWAFWDFLPTAAELAGLPPPKRTDGISIVPELTGRPQSRHEYFYWDYGHVRDKFLQAARWGNWKGVRIGTGSPIDLYDLERDPSEINNVAGANPQVVRRIEEILAEAYQPSPDYLVKG